MQFLDRVEEVERLKSFLARKDGALACLYGRRRIGKSRLLEEVLCGREHVVSHVADRSDPALQRARLAADMAADIPGFGDVSYSDWGKLFDRWQRDAARGSVLIIDELPYLVEGSPELPSVLQRIADGLRTRGQKIVVCGSSQRMMQGLVLDEKEPLYGRAREIIRLGPIGFEWMKKAFPKDSPFARLERSAVFGGVPRYWEICEGERDLWTALRRHVFSRQGVFHDEPRYLLQDDLRDAVQAASVLSLIGDGAERPVEIASRLQTPSTALARPINRLLQLGLAYRDIPFGCNVKDNKRTLYKLDDPFLRFWYRFVLPHYSDPYFLSTQAEVRSLRPTFDVFLGQHWERLVRETLVRRPLPGVPLRMAKVARWWGTGLDRRPMEIDVVAESPDRKTLLVGECKLSLTAAEARRALVGLVEKSRQLPFVEDYEKVEHRLFVAKNPPPGAISVDWCEEMTA